MYNPHIVKRVLTYCLLCFLITTIPYPQIISAQDPELKFNHITTRDGLSQNTVACIFQDSRGFMWFGTEGGLDKYDGRSFTNYHYNPSDTSSLLGNYFSNIVEDSIGNLWIGSERGLNMFDRSHNNFIRYEHDANDPSGLSGTSVLSIFEDREGNLWVGSSGGDFSRFDPYNKNFVRFPHNESGSGSLSKNICSIYEDSRNNIWVGTLTGDLSLFDREKEVFTPIYYQNAKLSNSEIKSITGDSKDNIWVGTYRNGLYVINFSGKGDPEIVHYINDVNDPGSISSNDIFTVFEDSHNRIWIGTENRGLNLFDRKRGNFLHSHQIPLMKKV